MTPYSPDNLDRACPDLVVIGNVIRAVNSEATAVRERGLPTMSFPAAMGSLLLDGRHSVVVTGTHGKTTTSALLSHVLVVAGVEAVFEPRSNTSRRDIHQYPYVNALRDAAQVFIKVPEPHDKVPAGEQLDVEEIVNDLKSEGVPARGSADVAELVRHVAAEARSGDLVLVMSNGAFGGFIPSLMTALASGSGKAS